MRVTYLRASSGLHTAVLMCIYRLRVLGGLQLTTAGDATRRIDVQPKPLALLAFVAVAGRHIAVRRDVILALFWPDLAAEHARVALRQALFHLRHAIGANVVAARADDTVTFVRELCSCDAVEFDDAVARGDAASAAALYAGPLLEGVHIKGAASELEERLDSERKRLGSVAAEVMWTLATSGEQRGDPVAVVHWAHRAVALAPDDEDVVRRAASLLERVGAGAAARRLLTTYVQRLADEYGAEPTAVIRELLWRVERASSADPPSPVHASSSASASGDFRTITMDAPRADPVAIIAPVVIGRRTRWVQRVVWTAVAPVMLAALGISFLFWPAVRDGPVTGSSAGRGVDVVSRSPVARRLYDEGMDRLRAYRNEEASQLFQSALREDSACVACEMRAGEALLTVRPAQALPLLHHAADRASYAPRREQLLSRFLWGAVNNDPRQLAVSDTLSARAPGDVEAQLAHASALVGAGRPLEALPRLRSITAADRGEKSAAIGGDHDASKAWWTLVGTLWNADSISAATQAAREWIARHPTDANAWFHLTDALAREGRYSDARIALARLAPRVPNDAGVMLTRARLAIRDGRYDVAGGLLRALEEPGMGVRGDALWWHTISLRNEGRQREAMQLARELRRAVDSDPENVSTAAMVEAQSLFELGELRAAAERFRSLAAQGQPDDSALGPTIARRRAWRLTHAGTAFAAAGDTASLIALIDTVAAVGAESGFARDPRLHYYLRGLLWCARGQPDSAERALRASLTSLSEGFTRENAELAAVLIGEDRPTEAIPLVRLALQGPMEASNAYITRTELQRLLARAYAAARQPDSAAVYRAKARLGWRGPFDPPSFTCSRTRLRAR